MNRIDRSRALDTQKGTTLIVALVLILLASLLALYAMQVGIFAQRTSAADVRARLVHEAAEAALSQGVAYFQANVTTALDPTNNALWSQCLASDTKFPCGTVPQCGDAGTTTSGGGCSSDSAGVSTSRRANTFYFVGGGTYDVNGNGSASDTLDTRSLPLDRLINTTAPTTTSGTGSIGNGYSVNYGVGALLCVVAQPSSSASPTECTASSTGTSSDRLVTLVATATIPGESASTTLSMMIGSHTAINGTGNIPPFVASGTITANGNLQIVTNPNSGGPGVPVSMWTRLDAYKSGTPNTCYLDGFIRDPSTGNTAPDYEGVNTKIIACDTCTCNSSMSLSYTSSGNKQQEGIDILDVDTVPQCTGAVTTACKPNLNVQPGEFPCDLFNYVFGQEAWLDKDGDGFCETRDITSYTAADGVTYQMGKDEAYLYQYATFIIPTTANKSKVSGNQLTTCAVLQDAVSTSVLKGSAYGIVWDQQGCGIGSNKQAGTVDNPVVLVEDGTTKMQGRLFGLLFVRPDLYGTDTGPLSPTTGAAPDGTASLSTDAGMAIYGSVVVQGTVTKINGTSAVIYQPQVLGNLLNEAALNPLTVVPASWTDRFSY